MIQPHSGPLFGFAGERVETRGYIGLMTTFSQGRLSRSFTIRYLIVDVDTFVKQLASVPILSQVVKYSELSTSYFALIGKKMLNELKAIASTPHVKIKFPTLMGEIITIKEDQKQARQCYVESLKPYLTSGGSSQVMSMDDGSPIRTPTIYKASMGDQDNIFDVDLRDDTINKGPKPIEELVKL
ncbi:hypothetical protein GmHk_U059473 [Glycine max]|nr:hypothetical protein GmHk_U059473 [Glycine max]